MKVVTVFHKSIEQYFSDIKPIVQNRNVTERMLLMQLLHDS